MGQRRRLILLILCFSAYRSSQASEQPVDYSRDIKPLLADHCYVCHGPIKQKSGLRLDTAAAMLAGGKRGPALMPGNAADSLIIGAATGTAGFQMPPDGEGKKLTALEIERLKAWITQGAKHPADETPAEDPRNYWSYQPVHRPPVHQVAHSDWVRNPIDAFVAAEHDKRGLKPRPQADPAVMLRRVYLDLIGLPPTREELHAFVTDPSDAAYEKVVDELLSRPQHGERWGRHWMDVWRYSDWYGSRAINEIRYSQRHIWRWRDWIVESLNADKGYDQMIVEMLAGDELASADPNITRATGFIGRNWYKFDRNVWMFDLVEHTSQAFLGLTLKCARCHDHKFDPISQRDYYRFRAFFEPHDVRTDPLSGNLSTEKDATLGLVFKEGVSRVYDKEAEVPTYLFARGDNRYPEKDQPLDPGVPSALGNDKIAIRPVPLPPESFYPSLRPEIVQQMLDSTHTSVKAAEAELATAGKAAELAQKQLLAFIEQASAGQSQPAPRSGTVLADRFEKPRPDLWKVVSGQWEYEYGHIAQKQTGTFPTMVSLVPHPQDFMARIKYKTTEAGSIHSVGVFFDSVELRDCQAVYTAAGEKNSTVQAFHRQAGVEHYPSNGIVPYPVRIHQEITLDLAVRGQQLNVWVNGDLTIAYALPMTRKSGTFALWTHAGAAEFSEVLIDPLPAEVAMAQNASEKTRSPFAPLTLSNVELALKLAQRSAILADKKLATARLDLAALEARIPADRAKVTGATDAANLAVVAARAERQAALARAEQDATALGHVLFSARSNNRGGAGGAPDDATKKAIADAEPKLAAAEKAVEAARAALQTTDAAYTSLGPIYPNSSTGRRLALARWIADNTNPRTARIAVNHIWLRHFGQAIVPTTANFGLNGNRPSHPELLDWLAAELTEPSLHPFSAEGEGKVRGWSMKHLHRLIVTSNAYRMASSDGDSANPNLKIDSDNRFLWRMNSRRMESEAVRDSVLQVSGQLDVTLGGPELAESLGQDSHRRSMYFRSTPNEKMLFLELFDQANPNECYRRQESVVPQQSLALVNSPLALNQSRLLAQRLSAEIGPEDSPGKTRTFIEAAYEQVLSRPPTPDEISACDRFLTRHTALLRAGQKTAFSASGVVAVTPPAQDPHLHARENLLHVLFNHNDFVTIR